MWVEVETTKGKAAKELQTTQVKVKAAEEGTVVQVKEGRQIYGAKHVD